MCCPAAVPQRDWKRLRGKASFAVSRDESVDKYCVGTPFRSRNTGRFLPRERDIGRLDEPAGAKIALQRQLPSACSTAPSVRRHQISCWSVGAAGGELPVRFWPSELADPGAAPSGGISAAAGLGSRGRRP